MFQSCSPSRHSISIFIILLASQCTSFVIHPNCRPFRDFPANTQSEIHSNSIFVDTIELICLVAYLFALQKIVSGTNHLSLRAATQDTGNWMDKSSIQAAYNRAAVPGNDQMTQVEGMSPVFYLVHSSNFPDFFWSLQHLPSP